MRELAREMAVSLVDEHSGAKLVEEPPTIPVSLRTLARSFEVLAEVAIVRAHLVALMRAGIKFEKG